MKLETSLIGMQPGQYKILNLVAEPGMAEIVSATMDHEGMDRLLQKCYPTFLHMVSPDNLREATGRVIAEKRREGYNIIGGYTVRFVMKGDSVRTFYGGIEVPLEVMKNPPKFKEEVLFRIARGIGGPNLN